tara:strand:- start:1776 stop:5084 length:3309 start_codon:yes stop_codon:yes gene_type:complete
LKINNLFVLVFALVVSSCADNKKSETLFERLSASYTGIDFENTITTNDSINILNYEYLYNGGGVGVGDFNKDNLPDVFFSGNLTSGKLYLNKGALKFEDITSASGINTSGKWTTGVSVIDVNQDGYDDVYLSVGGMGNKSEFPNLLYINNGDLTFTEAAAEYGLADQGESIQAVFFDYDLDGDLDMYLLTGGGFENSAISVRAMQTNGTARNTDRLYRNDYNEKLGHPVFTNVSAEAGITFEGFGLGVSVLDANNDNWPDLYISNDYLSRDLLYVNQQNGTFNEEGLTYFGHMSHFSMGNDVADIDNDGFTDVITVDMLPEDLKRRKLMSGANSYDIFQIALRYGYGHQYMRNMLQHNNGDGTYSEIGQFAGIDKTDWSWAPLLADFDNDGFNDLYITNGFGKDITDMDFVKFRESKSSSFGSGGELQKAVKDCLTTRPAIKVANYAFKNVDGQSFTKNIEAWGFEEASISSGAVYADFDNDGDLDLMASNINAPAFVYKNTLNDSLGLQTNYLKVDLQGSKNNLKGIGATVRVYSGSTERIRVNNPVRGFQSTVSTTLHFGLKDHRTIDSLIVQWPDGKKSIERNIKVNGLLTVSYDEANYIPQDTTDQASFLTRVEAIDYEHKDRFNNDYATQPLLMHKYSEQGPSLAVGDLNGDGLEDVFIGGSYGENSTILYQQKDYTFKKQELPETELFEDGEAVIFDANNDGKLDLYVTSGGSERYAGHKAYQDRLYFNTASGFVAQPLPEMLTSTYAVAAADFDNDGFVDLFVGGRVVPGKFPTTPESYILKNKGGNFVDVTAEVCPLLQNAGMVTDAAFSDYNKDGNIDLILAGEFMPITVLENTGSTFENRTETLGLSETTGLWNSIAVADFDNDGDTDFVAGNIGLNTVLNSGQNKALKVDYADFDNNGYVDPIFSKYEEGAYFPIATLDQLTQQLPQLKKNFLYYHKFAQATTSELLQLLKTPFKTLEAKELRSIFIEQKDTGFEVLPLPNAVQLAPVNSILVEDLNQDGFPDLLLVGNDYSAEVNGGRYDASFGTTLINTKDGNFTEVSREKSGFTVAGDSKSIVKVSTKDSNLILVGRNGETLATFKFKNTNTHNLNTK